MSADVLLTKIIATLGPASFSEATIKTLIQKGVRVFRINFSHGSFAEYKQSLDRVRSASEQLGIPVAVMGDLCGPKIRLGKVETEGIPLKQGMTVSFQREPVVASQEKLLFSTNYHRFIDEVNPGQRILLDDGQVELFCEEKLDDLLRCTVIYGNCLTSHKGVNLPDSELSVPAMTERDYRCAEFAVKQGFDVLALSFVRSGQDVKQLKTFLQENGARPSDHQQFDDDFQMGPMGSSFRGFIPIVSKIEKPQAIDHLDAILQETDAVMIARGDLGVEMDVARVAILQKQIVAKCHDYGIPVIVATQMLQSMIELPMPTRAEVSDVANAILDGVDAVMLSGETAVGKNPIAAVNMMNRIAIQTNSYIRDHSIRFKVLQKFRGTQNSSVAISQSVQTLVRELDISQIVLWSHYGGSAVYLSQHRIPIPILAYSENPVALRLMSMLYGLKPIYMQQPVDSAEFINLVDHQLQEEKWANKGDAVIFILREPLSRSGITNTLYVHKVGEG